MSARTMAPLYERVRPETLDEFVGQKHIVGPNSLLRRAIAADKLGSCIFYGPPGTGKTTLANIIAHSSNAYFEKLNAVSSGVADAKRVIEEAETRLKLYSQKTYLLLDECHRWNKAQSDSVLAAIEKGIIIFIGSTTENPYVSMTRAIVSRCRIFEFLPIGQDDIIEFLKRAVKHPKGLSNLNVKIDEEAYKHWAWASSGDLRTALNALELAVLTTPPDSDGCIKIDKTIAAQSIQSKPLSIDQSVYYDILSAFCKSLRGSDPNAALYWANRLIEAGVDPLIIARRLIVHASEDVGLADSNALNIAVNAHIALEKLGLPEGNIPLTHAIIYVCLAPKSNSVVRALDAAQEAVKSTKDDNVPHYLRDRSYPHIIDDNSVYKYPHDYGGYVPQQYLPDSLKNAKFYIPSGNGEEPKLIDRLNTEINKSKSNK
ncbi:MAG TPA: replication-associated recombination protein A [Clostridia bacterium]